MTTAEEARELFAIARSRAAGGHAISQAEADALAQVGLEVCALHGATLVVLDETQRDLAEVRASTEQTREVPDVADAPLDEAAERATLEAKIIANTDHQWSLLRRTKQHQEARRERIACAITPALVSAALARGVDLYERTDGLAKTAAHLADALMQELDGDTAFQE